MELIDGLRPLTPQAASQLGIPAPLETKTPQQADVDAFTATAGSFRRGVRSGISSVGGMLNNLIGQSAEALGMSDFAESRFRDAKHYTDFAEAVGPEVRDIGQIKDTQSLIEFVAGHAGSGVATTAPIVGLSLGLRRPVAGVLGGAGALEAGEQVGTLRADPTVMSTTTPGQRLANAAAKGAIGGAMELGGAGGMAARRLAAPAKAGARGVAKDFVKGTVGEAVTEGGQDLTGQLMHQQLNPAVNIDPRQTVNAMAAGAAGGGVMTGAATAASGLAHLAKTPQELRDRIGRRRPPLDPDGTPDDISADDTPQTAMPKMEAYDERVYETYGTREPDELSRKFADASDKFFDEVIKPAADKAAKAADWLSKKAADLRAKRTDDDFKSAAQLEGGATVDGESTRVKESRFQNRDEFFRSLGEQVLAGKKIYAPASNVEVADWLRKNGYKQAKEGGGEWVPATQKFSNMRDSIDSRIHKFMVDRVSADTKRGATPENLLKLSKAVRELAEAPGALEDSPMVRAFAKAVGEDKFEEVMAYAIEQVKGPGPERDLAMDAMLQAFKGRRSTDDSRLDDVQNVLRTFARPEYLADPELESVMMDELAPQVVSWLGERAGTADQNTEIMDKLRHVLGEKSDQAFDLLEASAKRHSRANRGAGVSETFDAPQSKDDSPYVDHRLGVEMTTDQARTAVDALRAEYGKKDVNFVARPVEGKPGMWTLDAVEADVSELDEKAWQRIRETKGYSGLKNGVLTVKSYTRNKFGKLSEVENKINLVALTHEMMRQEKKQTQQGGAKYVADMFSRGISALLTAKVNKAEPGQEPEMVDRFRGFKAEDLHKIPNSTIIGYLNEKPYTWGDIRRINFGTDERAVEARREMSRAKTPEERAAARKRLMGFYDEQRDIAEAATPSGPRFDDEAPKGYYEDTRNSVDGRRVVRFVREDGSVQDERPQDTLRGQTRGKPRNVEEDTGLPVGEGGAPSMTGPKSKLPRRRKGDYWNFKRLPSELSGVTPGAGPLLQRQMRQNSPEEKAVNDRGAVDIRRAVEESNKSRQPSPVEEANQERMGKEVAEDLWSRLSTKPKLSNMGKLTEDEFVSDTGAETMWELLENDQIADILVAQGYSDFAIQRRFAEARKYFDYIPEAAKVQKLIEASRKDPRVRKAADNNKLSAMNVGRDEEAVTPEQEKEVREYVERVLGPKAKVLFEKMEAAGSFANLSGVETIRISVDSLDPTSVAYHEAVHALMLRLLKANPRARAVLMRAAEAPHIVNRLRELLKDHPDALRQLTPEGQLELAKERDEEMTRAEAEAEAAEERLAYMYQFWAADPKNEHRLLNVGPETKGWFEKVKSFLRKVRALWADDLNTAMDVEAAGQILAAFHRGEFANPNTVSQVLAEKFPGDIRERMDKFWPQLGRFLDKFVWTASMAVRDMNYPMLTSIMDKFHVPNETSGKEPGFIQTWRTEYNRRYNKVLAVLKPMSQAQRMEFLEAYRAGRRDMPGAKVIEGVLDEAFDYMVKSGVKLPVWDAESKKVVYKDLQKIEDGYFPRVPDMEYLLTPEGKDGFIALLRKHGIEKPESVYENFTRGVNGSDPREDASIGLTFYAPQTNARQLGMIPDAELEPYLSKDIDGILSQYLARAARRAEYARRFGNGGELIREAEVEARKQGATEEQMRTFNESVQAMEGTLGANMSEELKQVTGWVMTYQNVRLLPLALFSSLVDPMGIVVRGGTVGEAAKAFWRGVRNLVKESKDGQFDFAATVGAISTAHDSAVMQDMYSSQFMPKTQQVINDSFFRINGMESWNRSMRTAAAAAAEQFIIRHATKPGEHSARYLRELGLSPRDVVVQDGRLQLSDKTVKAVNLWVDQAILRPNAAVRPIYMSDPHFMLISHLKQYMYLFQKTIISRVHHELQHGNYTPAYALAGYVPLIIASDMLRAMLTPGDGDDREGWDAADWLWSGVQRAGLFGPGQAVLDSHQDMTFGKTGIESIAGPTVQQLLDFLQATSKGSGIENELLKAIPGERFFR